MEKNRCEFGKFPTPKSSDYIGRISNLRIIENKLLIHFRDSVNNDVHLYIHNFPHFWCLPYLTLISNE